MIIVEHHNPGYAHVDKTHVCTCSYCGNSYDKGEHYGLNIPKAWRDANSWFVLKVWPRVYIRFTLPQAIRRALLSLEGVCRKIK